MINLNILKYHENRFTDLFLELKSDLKLYFKGFEHDSEEFFIIISESIKKETATKRCFEISLNDKIIGFLVIVLINNTACLKHIYISGSVKKEKVFRNSFEIIIKKLNNENNITSFDNMAFPFPDDYISQPLKDLGYDLLQRINMILEPIPEFTPIAKAGYVVSGINSKDLHSLAIIGKDSYKSSIDYKIEIEKRDVESYFELLKESYESYLNKDFSSVIYDLSGNILGFCIVEDAEEGEVIIQDFVVKTDNQNQGIGKFILYETIEKIRIKSLNRIILTVTEKNLNAKYLYEKIGFRFFSKYPVLTS